MRIILRWLPATALMVALFALSHQPGLPTLSLPFIDKAQHAVVYGILALTYAFALAPRVRDRRRLAMLVIGLAALYGATDELHQSLVAGRHASIADWIADVAGASIGASLLASDSFAGLLGLWENSRR